VFDITCLGTGYRSFIWLQLHSPVNFLGCTLLTSKSVKYTVISLVDHWHAILVCFCSVFPPFSFHPFSATHSRGRWHKKANVNLVKWSTGVIIKLFPLAERGCGPVTSMPILSQGAPTIMDFSYFLWGGIPQKICAHSWHCKYMNCICADKPTQKYLDCILTRVSEILDDRQTYICGRHQRWSITGWWN